MARRPREELSQVKGKARQGKARQGKARQGKARQGKARQGKAGQGKARQGKARQGNLKLKARQSFKLKRTRDATACSTAEVPVMLLRGLSDMTEDSLEALICRGIFGGADEASLEDHFTRFLEAAAGAMLLVRARPLSEATLCLLSVSAKKPALIRPFCV